MTARTVRRAVGAALLVVGAVMTPAVLRSVSIFQVRRVEVTGLHYLAPDAIVRALGLASDASVFDRVDPLERRLVAVHGVAAATVSRRIPGTLEVAIEERVPVALAPVEGRLSLVDRRGRVLPFDPSQGVADLPIAPADTAVLGVIQRVRESDPVLFGTIVSGRRDGGTVSLETEGGRLLLRVGAAPHEIQGLTLVMAEAARRGMRISEFDARFEGRVIVRGARRT